MPVLREGDFDKLAARVVDQFLSGRAKLADAAATEASSAGLNPDQIRRLVEAANTMTFLRMMDQRRADRAPDLLHEFDPIDARQVIRIVIDQAGVHVEPVEREAEPDSDDGELPDEMASVRMNPAEGDPGHTDSPDVAECEEACHDEIDPPGVATKKRSPAKPSPNAQRPPQPAPSKKAAQLELRKRKLAALFEDQRRQAEWAFEDTFAELASRFKRVYGPSYDAFEKDATAEYGDATGIRLINLLRSGRHLAPLAAPTREKTATLADHHISEDSPEIALFGVLVKIARDAARLDESLAWLRKQCTR
jgi:hypothetical protein